MYILYITLLSLLDLQLITEKLPRPTATSHDCYTCANVILQILHQPQKQKHTTTDGEFLSTHDMVQ